MNTNEIKEKIKEFISRALKNYEISDDENIFELGIVHSLFAIQLIMFIEKTFHVELEEEELNTERIKSIQSIASLIEEKKS